MTNEELKNLIEKYDKEVNRLFQENKKLKEKNNDLRRIYKNIYNRLFQNGNDELARYFQAQIDDCPTFYVEPIIDYAKEWENYKSRIDKAIEYINGSCFLLKSGNYIDLYKDDVVELIKILKGEKNE